MGYDFYKRRVDPQRFRQMQLKYNGLSEEQRKEVRQRIKEKRDKLDNHENIISEVRRNRARRVFNESLFEEPLGEKIPTLNDWRMPKEVQLNDEQKQRYNRYYERALEYCDEVVKGKAPNLMLFGKAGTGKTYLALSIMGTLLQQGQIVLFINTTALKRLAYRFNDPHAQERIDRLKGYAKLADLLIIDDIGAESGVSKERMQTASQTIQDLLYTFSNTTPILITSNVHLSELQSIYHERIISRLIPNSVKSTAKGKRYSSRNLLVFDKLQDLRNLEEIYATVNQIEADEGADDGGLKIGDWSGNNEMPNMPDNNPFKNGGEFD